MVGFQDSKGRSYAPKVTCRVIHRWEQATGRGLFADVFKALNPMFSAKHPRAPGRKELLDLVVGVFGNVSNLLMLLYESCQPSFDKPAVCYATGENNSRITVELSYEEFLDAMDAKEVLPAMVAGVEALFAFFPEAKPGENPTPDAEGEKLAEFLGEKFTKQPPLPASKPGATASEK